MATIVSLILGAAGLVVAVAGYVVNQRAIADEWTREWAVQRPVVYPLALPEWTYAMEASRYRGGNARLLPLKNGGRGPALDLWGEVSATDASSTTYSREILSGPIAAGELLDARIVPHPGIEHWGTAEGVLRYKDLAGGAYETRFECSLGPGNELVVTVREQTHKTPLETGAVTPKRGRLSRWRASRQR